MTKIFQVRDMEIRFDYEFMYSIHPICTVYVGNLRRIFRFIDDNQQIFSLCLYKNSFVYDEIIRKLIRDGQLSRTEIAMYDVGNVEQKTKTTNTNKINLELTFWGSLIAKDIL